MLLSKPEFSSTHSRARKEFSHLCITAVVLVSLRAGRKDAEKGGLKYEAGPGEMSFSFSLVLWRSPRVDDKPSSTGLGCSHWGQKSQCKA